MKGVCNLCKRWYLPYLLLIFMLVTILPAYSAYAATVISTDYPGVIVQPGANLTFPLTISGVSGKVSLSISSVPKDWDAQIFGSGRLINAVFVKPGSEVDAELRVKVPQDAADGKYTIRVAAQGAGGDSSIDIDITVKSGAVGSDEMEVQYPSLSGPDTATYNFRATLTNNSGRSRSYNLGVDAPEGWQVTFKPSYQNNQIASLTLEAGRSQDLDISVDPPDDVKAGKYTLTVAAISGQDVAKAELEVVITGNYRMKVSTQNERLNADVTAGREGSVSFTVENEGSADLHGITFSSSAPENWSVTFDPESIDIISSGETRQVTAFITPDSRAIAGDYMVEITANARETSESMDIRTTVHTSTIWGLVGVVIVAAVIGWVMWTFKRYGRR